MTLVPTSEIEGQWKLAQRLCNTGFVPQGFKGKPEEVLAAVLTGQEHGIGPMQALQSINVIQGKPTLTPELMRALVAREGHRIDTIDYSETKVTLKGTRVDTGAEAEVSWTMEDAKRAKLTGKGAWVTYPRAMLLARATAELCRLHFADIIAGLSYTEEELGGEAPAPAPEPVKVESSVLPLLPHEIEPEASAPVAAPPVLPEPQSDLPADEGLETAGGTGASAVDPPSPPDPGPAPSIDGDDDVAEAEIVDADDVGSSVSEAGGEEPDPAGDGGAPSSPPPADPMWSAGAWREEAKKRGIPQRGLLDKAKQIASENDLELPGKLADLIRPEIAQPLRVWLLTQ